MFTGITEELGVVESVEALADGVRLGVAGPVVTTDVQHGDSIAVNGVCLTVVAAEGERFEVDVVRETLRKSSLHGISTGDRVNLERAMALGDRLGGHIVQGHVDGTGVVRELDDDGLTRFSLPEQLSRYLVAKGSITVDGVSLTVVDVGPAEFSVALIPTTKELTTLGVREAGDAVNIEVDVLAKHVERLTQARLDHLAESATSGQGDNGDAGQAQ